jgi:predicted transcriptional regulator
MRKASEQKRWEREEVILLGKIYSDTRVEVLSQILGRSTTSINAKAKMMGLSKSPEFIRMQRLEAVAEMQERARIRQEKENKGKRINTGFLEVKGNVRIHRMI